MQPPQSTEPSAAKLSSFFPTHSTMRQPFSFIPSVILAILAVSAITPQAEARAFFVFGDSLVDNGNNNYLLTSARADAPPYGIDYPTHRPTGRFSNGLNIPDIISTYLIFCLILLLLLGLIFHTLCTYSCTWWIMLILICALLGERMGMESPLPYLAPENKGQKLLNGANFASAGVGILNDTGFQFVSSPRWISILVFLFWCKLAGRERGPKLTIQLFSTVEHNSDYQAIRILPTISAKSE